MKKTSFLLVIGIIAALFVGAYTGYLYWQKARVDADVNLVEKSLNVVKDEVLQNEHQQVLQAISAKQAVNDLKMNSVKWSEVIKDIVKTIPKQSGFPLVEVLSYSGSSGRELSMNVKTVAGSENPYFDVADLIEAFTAEKAFEDTFVSSISSGTDDEGNEILTFLLSAKYRTDGELKEAIGDILEESLSAEPIER